MPDAASQEKLKDYRNVVALQITLLLISLLGPDLLRGLHVPHADEVSWFLFLLLAGIYLFMLWDLLRNFTRKRYLIRLVQVWILMVYGATILINQFLVGHVQDPAAWNRVLHLAVLAVELLVMRLVLLDLFQGARSSVDKLWASAALYFMTGLAFTNLYRFLHLGDPDAYGSLVDLGFAGYYDALFFSFSALVGLDNAFPQCSHTFRNLMLLEGVLGQLYLVLLISRVLLPEAPSQDEL